MSNFTGNNKKQINDYILNKFNKNITEYLSINNVKKNPIFDFYFSL